MTRRETTLKNGLGTVYRAERGFWIHALMLAHDYGWRPETLRTSYLAPDFFVSAEDARNMHRALERLFMQALLDPSQVFPVPVDMAELHRFKEFIAGGEFMAAAPDEG
ncbi:MAG: hypothetical protein R3298_08970 [Gammaproteobacteria bacterium]|nr:hypothetical protein [Gammaproteobacteria bacterium]